MPPRHPAQQGRRGHLSDRHSEGSKDRALGVRSGGQKWGGKGAPQEAAGGDLKGGRERQGGGLQAGRAVSAKALGRASWEDVGAGPHRSLACCRWKLSSCSSHVLKCSASFSRCSISSSCSRMAFSRSRSRRSCLTWGTGSTGLGRLGAGGSEQPALHLRPWGPVERGGTPPQPAGPSDRPQGRRSGPQWPVQWPDRTPLHALPGSRAPPPRPELCAHLLQLQPVVLLDPLVPLLQLLLLQVADPLLLQGLEGPIPCPLSRCTHTHPPQGAGTTLGVPPRLGRGHRWGARPRALTHPGHRVPGYRQN